MQPPEAEQLLAAALGHHQAGRLPEAEALYRRILSANPNHVMGLQFLGVLAHQLGRNDAAIDLIGKAIALNGRIPECHYNVAAAYQALGRLDEAAAHYAKAIALKNGFAEAHFELANVLARQDKLEEAAARYRRALVMRPNFVGALINLGNVLKQQGKRDEAVQHWRQALAQQPSHPIALMNIGIALKQEGKLNEAIAQLRQVVSIRLDYVPAYYNLGNALLEQGNIAEALDMARRALAANETPEIKSLLAKCICSPLVHPGFGDLRGLMVRALSEAWARPVDLAPTCSHFLSLNDAIRNAMARAAQAWPTLLTAAELTPSPDLTAIAEDPLLRVLLETTPVCYVGIERFVTALRFNLLTAARTNASDAITDPVLSLYCAVGGQCFINNYVFVLSEAEQAAVGDLRESVIAALQSGAAIAPLSLVALAAYEPLYTLPDAESLRERPWPPAVQALLAQQVGAPLEERRARASMPALTAIDDDVSIQVRGQYEESPYLQWVKAVTAYWPETVDGFMRNKYPQSPFVALGKEGPVDVLVAGCGTGQHPIDTALKFKSAQVLGVDLSLTSLCYAQRQTRALGLRNIDYAQADIMKLAATGRSFDVIESVGVLHHLADPFAGWRVLVSMLRPGGLMLIGLYSEIGRQDIVAAREFIAQRGYRPTPQDIRRCRQELFDCADGMAAKNVTLISDFFSANSCRDLLFHVQEHRLRLPEIAAFIADNRLQFIGFDLDPQVRRDYAQRFPADVAMTDLTQWERFEIENPQAFQGMYRFWLQQPSARA